MKLPRIVSTIVVCAGLGLASACAQDADGVFTKVDKAPIPKLMPPPQVPSAMRGVSGMVSLTLVIDESGAVVDATVSKSTHAEFEQPSLDAVKRWKFQPAEKDGHAVKTKVAIPVRFSS
jgi:protein TonB